MSGRASKGPVLTTRELGRATLARQLLLERADVGVTEAVGQLGGVQAQEPRPPFVGLFARLAGFRTEDLLTRLHGRDIVRATYLRGTLHLVPARDYAALRATFAPMLAEGLRVLGDRAAGLEVDRVLAKAAELYAERPRDFTELRGLLSEAFPGVNERALGFSVRMHLPLVMVPTDDRWGFPSASRFTPAAGWLAEPIAEEPAREELVRRYLAAFGPATPADAQAWSGLKGLKPVFDGMRDELECFSDERGRALFDLPGAPRPGAEVAAPPRFLPEFDNLVLAHADRSRVVADDHRPLLVTKNLRVRATVLHDGVVRGTWETERRRGAATLRIAPFGPLTAAALRELTAEGEAVLRYLEPDATTYAVAAG